MTGVWKQSTERISPFSPMSVGPQMLRLLPALHLIIFHSSEGQMLLLSPLEGSRKVGPLACLLMLSLFCVNETWTKHVSSFVSGLSPTLLGNHSICKFLGHSWLYCSALKCPFILHFEILLPWSQKKVRFSISWMILIEAEFVILMVLYEHIVTFLNHCIWS